jgi:GNAT superfamily N-acetyltransferase
VEIRELHRDKLSGSELGALTQLLNIVDPNQLPGDAPITDALTYDRLSPGSTSYRFWNWALFDGDRVIAAMQAHGSTVENTELFEVGIAVDPNRRRRGLGATMLDHVRRSMAVRGRTRLWSWGSLDETNRGFWEGAIGLELAFDERISRCWLAEVDPELMQTWIDRAEQRAAGYHLERWKSPCPDELVEQFARAVEAMDDAPHEGLQFELEHFDAERVRDLEVLRTSLGHDSWAIMAIETATGLAAGYTGISIAQARPELGQQIDTVTLADHRDRGIGRWMKAEMWQWLRRERPDVASLDTGNAESNDAMLAINMAMGFRESVHIGVWQEPTAVPVT